jgi:Cep192 domain 4
MKVRPRRASLAGVLMAGAFLLGAWRAPIAAAAGQGGGPVATLSPTSLAFGTVALGGMSAPQTVTLSNTGGAELDVTSISIVDHDFTESNNCGAGLAPDSFCTITVTFTPLLFGMRNASLMILDNAADSPQSVSLTGTGMGPAVTLSASVLNFANQLATTTSVPQSVILTNTGDAPLTIASINVIGTFSQSNNCPVSPATLAVNAECNLTLTFQPLIGGATVGLVEITDDASPVPQAVTLNGVGSDFTLSVSPPSNTVTAGQGATYTLTATPEGGFNEGVSFSCSALPAGAGCTFSPSVVTPDGTNPATTALTLSTTARSGTSPLRTIRTSPPGGVAVLLACGLYELLAGWLVLAAGRRRVRSGLTILLLASALFAAAAGVACGGGSSTSSGGSGTPAGSYTVLVSGSVVGTGISNPVSLTVVIQ